MKPQSPTLGHTSPNRCTPPNSPQTCLPTNWVPSSQTYEPMGSILIETTTEVQKLLCVYFKGKTEFIFSGELSHQDACVSSKVCLHAYTSKVIGWMRLVSPSEVCIFRPFILVSFPASLPTPFCSQVTGDALPILPGCTPEAGMNSTVKDEIT